LIQSRLAKLSESARRMLDVAVAMGRVFEFEVVARASALSDEAALDALDELRAARLIVPQGSDGTHFTFDHPLTMEVAYREVGDLRHRLLHRRVAEAMETIYGRQQLDLIAGLLAWHFAEGNAPDRAAPYAYRAGQLAAQIAAWREAIDFYRQALQVDHDDARRAEILMTLGEAYLRLGEAAQASDTFRAAIDLYKPASVEADAARLALGQSLLNQARYAEAIDLAKQVIDHGRAAHIANAEVLWGTVLSIEGADLIGANEHLQRAEQLLRQPGGDPVRLAQTKFDQGSVAAQQGDLNRAVALYREALSITEATDASEALSFRILANNNLAYHLHLLNDPTAIDYAQRGLTLARDQGVLGLQPFLLSTLGEIRLAQDDVDAAQQYFDDGLALAERLSMPERIAGLTANLGLVAQRRGETASAIHRLSTALAQADALNLKHLAAQIRVWLAPLLPPQEARLRLSEARAFAESSGRQRLLEEVQRLEREEI
jgi:tetratricopeptide (TPR) repeat protein